MSLKIIGGKFGGRVLKTPKGSVTRPTTSMARGAVFNRCQHLVEEANFLDLFAGSGAMGFEALSRGASVVTFIEQNPQAAKCIKENAADLDVLEQCKILQRDVFSQVRQLTDSFDLIYIDPPYDLNISNLLEEIGSKKLLKLGGILFLEERSKKSLPATVNSLQYVDTRRYGEASVHQYQRVEILEK